MPWLPGISAIGYRLSGIKALSAIKAVMIDIIIPNYNGTHLLPTCLGALKRQTRRDFLVTIVDDGSSDESLTMLKRDYPEVQVIALARNGGLAKAVNAGIKATSRPFVVLLNNDTEADAHWIERLVGALERYPQYAFAASKLMLFDRRDHLHSAGDYYQPDGVPGSRGVWERDRGQYDAMEEVFGPCAGAAAYRRTALAQLAEDGKVLDEDLVMYCEDVDLNLRARIAGLRTIYVPTAVVYHMLSATGGGTLASYYCGRNFPLVWLKNMPGSLASRYWPALLRSQVGYTVHSLWHSREKAARARLRGQFAALRALPRFLAKRRKAWRERPTNQLTAELLVSFIAGLGPR
jgi:GT2 family glycosyltransferase